MASVETTVFSVESDSGPVCDIVFAAGKSKIYFTQGSAVMRDYEIIPVESVKWGTATADTMASSDSGKVDSLVYVDAGNLAELSGSVSLMELKKIAASMQEVR